MDSDRIINHISDQFSLNADGIHGRDHWRRVLKNGRELSALTGADLEVVELFAVLHDSRRKNDGVDRNHGARAAELARELNGNLYNLTDSQLHQLCVACRDHSNAITDQPDVTIATCWDADRLDLGRVGIRVDPSQLCTAAAKEIWTKNSQTEKQIYHYTTEDRLKKIIKSGCIKRTLHHSIPAVFLSFADNWENLIHGPWLTDKTGTASEIQARLEKLSIEKKGMLDIHGTLEAGHIPARVIINQEKVTLSPAIELFKRDLIEEKKRNPNENKITDFIRFCFFSFMTYPRWRVCYQDIPADAFLSVEVFDGETWVPWT